MHVYDDGGDDSNPLTMWMQCFILHVKSNNGSIGGALDYEAFL